MNLDEVTPEELLDLLGRPTDGGDVTAEEIAAFLAAGHDEPTKRRVLGWLSKVGKKVRAAANREATVEEVTVYPVHTGRVTGYEMRCSCGLKSKRLAASKRLAGLAGVGHLRADHDSVGRVSLP